MREDDAASAFVQRLRGFVFLNALPPGHSFVVRTCRLRLGDKVVELEWSEQPRGNRDE